MLVSQFVLSHAGHVEQAVTVSRPRVDANHDGVDAAFHFSQAIGVSTCKMSRKSLDTEKSI